MIMHSLLTLLSEIPVDSLGLNEDELAAAAGVQPGLSPAGWQECMREAVHLREKLGIFRVAVHTRDYILSVMQQGLVSAQDELIALQNGVEAATSLAATGFANRKAEAKINPLGLEAVEEFCRKGAVASGRGAFLHQGEVIVSLMPSLVVDKPRITVGLGDTATATMFFQELLAIRKMSD
jgi:ADP-dependent phosphofructokinase/glucokinase